MRKILVITNDGAGSSGDETFEQALDLLREHAEVADVTVVSTSTPDDLDELVPGLGDEEVVVAGGDGSIHAVIAALHRHDKLADRVVGLLPMGTGNDFARGNDIPLDLPQAALVIRDGEPRARDLIVTRGASVAEPGSKAAAEEAGDPVDVVVNNVHAGAGAQASRRGARWKERLGSIGVGKVNLGKLGYPIGAVLAAFQPAGVKLRVIVDGEVVDPGEKDLLMVAVGNSSHVGGGTELTPDADPGDGLIDVMVSRSVGAFSTLDFVRRLRSGEHDERGDVTTYRGREVRLEGEEFWCSADGEIEGPFTARAWSLEPKAYLMPVPKA